MATREIINQRPVLSGVLALIVILVATGAILFTRRGDDAYKPAQSYFTVDDGRTYFTDDITKLPPFEHDGQEAVQCYLFRCGETRFVGYLMKLPPQVKHEMETFAAAGREFPRPQPHGDGEETGRQRMASGWQCRRRGAHASALPEQAG